MFRETAGDSDGNEVERERGEGEGQQQQEEEENVTTDSPTAMPVVAESLLTSFIEISGLDPMTASHYLQVELSVLSIVSHGTQLLGSWRGYRSCNHTYG
jgi:hypothetical protein